ncbi:related to Extracellular metalloprotease 1 [Cephalotrichum gorgonifer]|uniref:Related to Extracellular metalloprotease 1 n=1 Tax=Cephalotrichum gorgonifer TaxID=2041049 RepID=A0AAE8N093_9PEZI|nr:related to Extracellular metalloprotease 1 [Cephalotrichum gorgonifer]
MFLRATIQLGFAAAAMGHNMARDPDRHCGIADPASLVHLAALDESLSVGSLRGAAIEPIEVDLYFHVVTDSANSSEGRVTDAQLEKQLLVLNTDYEPAGISFVHRNTTRTVSDTWAHAGDDLGMKRTLRQGGYNALNVYFLTEVDGYLGFATFPRADAPEGSDAFIEDGAVILAGTVPGGGEVKYNLGKTTTHEAGHWFGLYHTFQGGCNGAGDQVDDTPAEASPASGCQKGRDSCPRQPGLDPVENYMDYSDDACMTEFSPGQIDRMRAMWYKVRD